MRVFHFVRGALRLCVAVAMLAGCGGHAGDGVVPNIAAPNSLPNHKTFNYTGGAQNFKVPAGVTQLRVIALGAHVRPEHEQLRIPIGNDLEDQTPEMRLAPSVVFGSSTISSPRAHRTREMGHFRMGGRSRKNASDPY